ncbi:MAG: hypothetical protein ACI4OB_07090 [Christensenellales bacterium]
MATAESVKLKIQGLISNANATTGNTDATLTDAVASLIAGFGTGGGAGLTYDMGEFVLDVDKTALERSQPHNLGEIPEFILVWTDDFADLSEENPSEQQCNLGYIWLKNLTGMLQSLSTVSTGDSLTVNFILTSEDYRIKLNAPNSTTYIVKQPTAEYFSLHRTGSSYYWRAGVTYKYFVSKAWWNTGDVINAE